MTVHLPVTAFWVRTEGCGAGLKHFKSVVFNDLKIVRLPLGIGISDNEITRHQVNQN